MEKVKIKEVYEQAGGYGLIALTNSTVVNFGAGYGIESLHDAILFAVAVCNENRQTQAHPDRLTIAAGLFIPPTFPTPEIATVLMGKEPPSGQPQHLNYYTEAEAKYRLMIADAIISQSQKI